jgi:flavin reductase (DIM6/NTAB) family NADH-FMN oxidoreductase RutF
MLGDPLSLEVHASSITVRMPGTDYWVTYEKRDDHQRLMLVRSWMAASVTTPAIIDFRSRSRRAAIDKARELGWLD